MTSMPLHLMVHPDPVTIVRLDPGDDPSWEWQRGPFASLTRTQTETSVVCLAEAVPAGPRQEGPFQVVEVAGPLDFEMVGVMHAVLDPLLRGHISVVPFGTYDTDWVLVPAAEIDSAISAWRRAGLVVTPTVITGDSTS